MSTSTRMLRFGVSHTAMNATAKNQMSPEAMIAIGLWLRRLNEAVEQNLEQMRNVGVMPSATVIDQK